MWRSRAKAAEAENQRLQAEVARLNKEHDVCGYLVREIQHTATEAALRYVQKRWPHFYLNESDIQACLKALLGEEGE